MSTDSCYLASTEAVMDSSVLIWDRPTIRGLAERYPKLLENALLTASDYVAWHLMSHIGLACYTGRQRVAQVLVTLARTIGQETKDGVALHLTNEELANAANVTPFAVSRLITQWQRDRTLVKRRGQGFAAIVQTTVLTCEVIAVLRYFLCSLHSVKLVRVEVRCNIGNINTLYTFLTDAY